MSQTLTKCPSYPTDPKCHQTKIHKFAEGWFYCICIIYSTSVEAFDEERSNILGFADWSTNIQYWQIGTFDFNIYNGGIVRNRSIVQLIMIIIWFGTWLLLNLPPLLHNTAIT